MFITNDGFKLPKNYTVYIVTHNNENIKSIPIELASIITEANKNHKFASVFKEKSKAEQLINQLEKI